MTNRKINTLPYLLLLSFVCLGVQAAQRVVITPASVSLSVGRVQSLTLSGKDLTQAARVVLYQGGKPSQHAGMALNCPSATRCEVTLTPRAGIRRGVYVVMLQSARKLPVASAALRVVKITTAPVATKSRQAASRRVAPAPTVAPVSRVAATRSSTNTAARTPGKTPPGPVVKLPQPLKLTPASVVLQVGNERTLSLTGKALGAASSVVVMQGPRSVASFNPSLNCPSASQCTVTLGLDKKEAPGRYVLILRDRNKRPVGTATLRVSRVNAATTRANSGTAKAKTVRPVAVNTPVSRSATARPGRAAGQRAGSSANAPAGTATVAARASAAAEVKPVVAAKAPRGKAATRRRPAKPAAQVAAAAARPPVRTPARAAASGRGGVGARANQPPQVTNISIPAKIKPGQKFRASITATDDAGVVAIAASYAGKRRTLKARAPFRKREVFTMDLIASKGGDQGLSVVALDTGRVRSPVKSIQVGLLRAADGPVQTSRQGAKGPGSRTSLTAAGSSSAPAGKRGMAPSRKAPAAAGTTALLQERRPGGVPAQQAKVKDTRRPAASAGRTNGRQHQARGTTSSTTASSASVASAVQAAATATRNRHSVTIEIPCGGETRTLDFDSATPAPYGDYWIQFQQPLMVTYEPGRNIELDACASPGWSHYRWGGLSDTVRNDTGRRATYVLQPSRDRLEAWKNNRQVTMTLPYLEITTPQGEIRKLVFSISFRFVGDFPAEPEITDMWIDDYRPGLGGQKIHGKGIVDPALLQNPDSSDGVFYLQGHNFSGITEVKVGRVAARIMQRSQAGTFDLIKAKVSNFRDTGFEAGYISVHDTLGGADYRVNGVTRKMSRFAYWVLDADWANGLLSQFTATIGAPIGSGSISLLGDSTTFEVPPYDGLGGRVHIDIADMSANSPTLSTTVSGTKQLTFTITVPFETSGNEIVGRAFGRAVTGDLISPELRIVIHAFVNRQGELTPLRDTRLEFASDFSLDVANSNIPLSLIKGWLLGKINAGVNGGIDKQAIETALIDGLNTIVRFSGAKRIKAVYPVSGGRVFFDIGNY